MFDYRFLTYNYVCYCYRLLVVLVGGSNSGCNCGNSSTNRCNSSSGDCIYITYSCSYSVCCTCLNIYMLCLLGSVSVDEAFVFLKTYSMEPLFVWCTPVVVCVNEQGQVLRGVSEWSLGPLCLYLSTFIHGRGMHG